MKISIKKAAEILSDKDKILILFHKSPDGDAIGSAFALCRAFQSLNKQCRVLCSDEVPSRYSYLTKIIKKQEFTPSFIILVDTANPALLGNIKDEYIKNINLCIDHHVTNIIKADYKIINTNAAANCENIYDLITAMKANIDRDIATALYTGISTDTGCFKFGNTTAKTHTLAAKFIKLGVNSSEINQIMFDTKKKSQVILEKRMLESLKYYHDGKIAVVLLTDKIKKGLELDIDDTENLSAISRQTEGVLAGITVKQTGKGVYKISLRTRFPVNAAQICADFGGGGHEQSAGCEMTGSLKNVIENIVNAAQKRI